MTTLTLPKHFFVTGTDTGVGKTTVTQHLIRHYVAQGLRVVGMKPVASGCRWIDGVWQNEDVAAMCAAANIKAPLQWVNPYCFDPAIAPHIAAAQAGVAIDLNVIIEAYKQLQSLADVVIVEGAGGLLVPLNAEHTMLDVMAALQLPALLVVGMRLGCINHALLTHQVLQTTAIRCCGWVANQLDPDMPVLAENVATLSHWLGQAPSFSMPYQAAVT